MQMWRCRWFEIDASTNNSQQDICEKPHCLGKSNFIGYGISEKPTNKLKHKLVLPLLRPTGQNPPKNCIPEQGGGKKDFALRKSPDKFYIFLWSVSEMILTYQELSLGLLSMISLICAIIWFMSTPLPLDIECPNSFIGCLLIFMHVLSHWSRKKYDEFHMKIVQNFSWRQTWIQTYIQKTFLSFQTSVSISLASLP